jgi:hypothetical protein
MSFRRLIALRACIEHYCLSAQYVVHAMVLVIVGVVLPSSVRAERLVTHYFEGVVDVSDSALVNVGDRLRGTITYDLDSLDREPDDPNAFFYWLPPGWALEEFPVDSPVGMSYTVGSHSHRTSELFELLIDNDSDFSPPDFIYIGSDALGGPGTSPPGAYIELGDPTGTALSSDRPPVGLDLAKFAETTFWGFDGQDSFTAQLDVLQEIPEPATVMLLVAASLFCGAALLIRRRGKEL